MTNGRSSRITGALALFPVVTAGVAKAADSPDSWVTMKMKVALMTTEGIGTKDLDVDTVNGIVTLHGMVATEVDKTKAETVARGMLVAATMKRLAQVFADERAKLDGQWGREGSVSTEDLRLALRRYRSFFGRRLSFQATPGRTSTSCPKR